MLAITRTSALKTYTPSILFRTSIALILSCTSAASSSAILLSTRARLSSPIICFLIASSASSFMRFRMLTFLNSLVACCGAVLSLYPAAMAAAVPLPSCLRYSRQNFSCAGLSFSYVVFLPAFGVVFLPEFLTAFLTAFFTSAIVPSPPLLFGIKITPAERSVRAFIFTCYFAQYYFTTSKAPICKVQNGNA